MIENKINIKKEELFNILKLYGEQNKNVINLVDLDFKDMTINLEGIEAKAIYNVNSKAKEIYNDFQEAEKISNFGQIAEKFE